MPKYLQYSFDFEIIFTIGITFEFLASIIAGYLIILYSKDEKSNLRTDPITGMDVPSLIFVYNQ